MSLEVKNCWEFWHCPYEVRNNCPAYINDVGDICWKVAGSFVRNSCCPRIQQKYNSCKECAWYHERNK